MAPAVGRCDGGLARRKDMPRGAGSTRLAARRRYFAAAAAGGTALVPGFAGFDGFGRYKSSCGRQVRVANRVAPCCTALGDAAVRGWVGGPKPSKPAKPWGKAMPPALTAPKSRRDSAWRVDSAPRRGRRMRARSPSSRPSAAARGGHPRRPPIGRRPSAAARRPRAARGCRWRRRVGRSTRHENRPRARRAHTQRVVWRPIRRNVQGQIRPSPR